MRETCKIRKICKICEICNVCDYNKLNVQLCNYAEYVLDKIFYAKYAM